MLGGGNRTIPNLKKTKISIRSIVVKAKGHVSADLAGEAAVLGLRNGVYYGLNKTGTEIWSFLSQPRQVGEICGFLAARYNVSKERCERDVAALLEQLDGEGLVEIRDGPPT